MLLRREVSTPSAPCSPSSLRGGRPPFYSNF